MSGRNLLIAVILNFTITIAEFVGGLLSNSLALLSDALHNFGDGVAILVAFIANRISRKESDKRKTFGYKRIEILVAFLNSVFLVAICVFLIYEAFERIRQPESIKGLMMFLIGGIGLVVNFVAVLLLHTDSSRNMNVRAAYLHLLGDTLSSVAVIIGGILIYFLQVWWVDPLITILISLYILKETYRLLKESVNILMQSTPSNIDLELIKNEIEFLPEVMNIHHIHAWNLSENELHFEGHVDLTDDLRISNTDKIRHKIEKILSEKYHINHVTLQMEFGSCDNTNMIHHK
ncbi:MAG: cobalt transporter [Bacteroides sp. SM23_62_1]|nr:MAG: cobalt transporter [Bacteroides sp. SM23_62_1]